MRCLIWRNQIRFLRKSNQRIVNVYIDMQKNIGLDCLKIIAAFTVVLIHAPNPHQVPSWDLALSILPSPNALFALMAGMLMSNLFAGPMDFSVWVKKRISRLVVPYLIWEFGYVLSKFFFDFLCQKAIIIGDWSWWASRIFFGTGSIQLYFVIMLFYAQCVVALIWYNCQTKITSRWFKILSLLFGMIACFSFSLLAMGSDARKFVFVFGYLLVGIALSWFPNVSWIRRRWVFCFLVFGLVFSILLPMCLELTIELNQVVQLLNCVMWVGVACAFSGKLPGQENIMILASCTMGIYLVHVFFTRMMLLTSSYIEPFLGRALFPITSALIAFTLSFCVILLTKRWRFLWGN
jgi:hypothetical protein